MSLYLKSFLITVFKLSFLYNTLTLCSCFTVLCVESCHIFIYLLVPYDLSPPLECELQGSTTLSVVFTAVFLTLRIVPGTQQIFVDWMMYESAPAAITNTQTEWLKQEKLWEIYFLTILETGTPGIKFQPVWFLLRAIFLVCRKPLSWDAHRMEKEEEGEAGVGGERQRHWVLDFWCLFF